MIYTNEPANVFYVLVSAFRSNLCDEVNMSRHRHMVNSLRNAPLEYGSVESTDLTGCYREAIASAPTEELTVRVRCGFDWSLAMEHLKELYENNKAIALESAE